MKRSPLKRKPCKLKRSKAKSHSWWFKKTKETFNKYIRLRDSDEGMCICVTCEVRIPTKESNAGHYMHSLHFVEDNQHTQCRRCNLFLSGNLAKYTLFMIDKYGRERVDELHKEKMKPHKYGISDLRDIREEYKERIKRLESL